MGLLSKLTNVAGKVTSGVKNLVTSSLGAAKSIAAKAAPASSAMVTKSASIVKPAFSVGSKALNVVGTTALAGTVFKVAEKAGQAMGSASRAKYEARQARRQAAQPVPVTPTPSAKSAGTMASVLNYVQTNPIKSAGMVAGGAAALYGVEQLAEKFGVRGGAGFIGSKPRKQRKKSKKRSTKRRSSRRRKKRGYGTAKQYARKGGKKVYRTKNGQPYILLASGKARFVKK